MTLGSFKQHRKRVTDLCFGNTLPVVVIKVALPEPEEPVRRLLQKLRVRNGEPLETSLVRVVEDEERYLGDGIDRTQWLI